MHHELTLLATHANLSENTMIFLMVLKNLLIFASGSLFGVVGISFITAYYMLVSERNRSLSDNVQFEEDSKTDTIYWNPPKSFLDALETFYTVLAWHISGRKKEVAYRSKKRAKVIFVCVLLAFIILLVGTTILSLDIKFIQAIQENEPIL